MDLKCGQVKAPAANRIVFDPRANREMDMQACPLGSLLRANKVQVQMEEPKKQE